MPDTAQQSKACSNAGSQVPSLQPIASSVAEGVLSGAASTYTGILDASLFANNHSAT